MQITPPPPDRRHFLRMALGASTCAALSACGGGGGGGGGVSEAIVVVPAPVAAAPATPPVVAGAHPLNLALNVAYLGAQYYGVAARGTPLAATLTGGTGRAGIAGGARQATFTDALIAAHAAELADDKRAHVVSLRERIGPLAAAQPMLDLSTGATSAFSIAAQAAGIVAPGAAFDPYAGDENFLLGAFLIENAVAATYRTLLAQGADASGSAILSTNLADAIYHGGLIRALLDDRAAASPGIDTALDKATALFATLDGSNVGDQTLAGANGTSSNILDADGRPIPFTRATGQVLKSLYLSSDGVGGFLPTGANGIA